jgi:hypothetical protein
MANPWHAAAFATMPLESKEGFTEVAQFFDKHPGK